MLAGQSPRLHGDGRQSRDFTFVDDVIQANLLASDAPGAAGQVYNIACGRRTSLLDLVATINRLLGTDIVPVHDAPRPGDVRHSQADVSRATAELGYRPRTSIEAGVRRCIEHFTDRAPARSRIATA
jgi:nucleoside-diphosphate-sugar epimerase